MGVENLSPLYRKASVKVNKLEDALGTIFAVDLSVMLHTKDLLKNIFKSPPVCLAQHVYLILNRMLRVFKKAASIPILYTDGVPHPTKAEEDASRASARLLAYDEFR